MAAEVLTLLATIPRHCHLEPPLCTGASVYYSEGQQYSAMTYLWLKNWSQSVSKAGKSDHIHL